MASRYEDVRSRVERDGEQLLRWCIHAANEQDVINIADAFIAKHPEHEISGGRDGTTVKVALVDLDRLRHYNAEGSDA